MSGRPAPSSLSYESGPRAKGAQPVGVRADPLLPPQARGREPRRPHPRRARRDLRGADRARTATTSSTSSNDRSRRRRRDGWHLFGTDQLGRDYLSRVIFGLRTSLWVALFVATRGDGHRDDRRRHRRATTAGRSTTCSCARRPDPRRCRSSPCCSCLSASTSDTGKPAAGSADPRAPLLGRRSRASSAASSSHCARRSSSRRRRPPGQATCASCSATCSRDCVGPIVVTMTLIIATAILLEAALSFLGFGIQPPTPALGKLIAEGRPEGFSILVARDVPGDRDRRRRPRRQLHRRRPARRARPDQQSERVPDPVLSIRD